MDEKMESHPLKRMIFFQEHVPFPEGFLLDLQGVVQSNLLRIESPNFRQKWFRFRISHFELQRNFETMEVVLLLLAHTLAP